MEKFKNNVPFDPGYSKISFSFLEQISYLTEPYRQTKIANQKKFQLGRLESSILELINKSTSFYLGCMLWGGFINSRFKNEPKEITGNNTLDMSKEELAGLDCGAEAKIILQYIEGFDRDCKYFLNKPAKLHALVKEILENYIEFAQLNNNFINIKRTDEIKLPKAFEHFKTLTNEQLDALCDKIYATIEAGKIEALLEIGFYQI